MESPNYHVLDSGFFLGTRVEVWLKVWAAAKCRRITILKLLEQFEIDHPTDYYAWEERHGVMAEVLELVNATKTRKM